MYKYSALSLAIVSILSIQAHAADDAAQSTTPSVDETAAVVVTGTRAKNRTAHQSLQPVDVISGDTLRGSGSSELGSALARLIPSINFPRPAVVDGAELVRPAQLRGLSPDQVLVLVNGKRLHTSAFINLGGAIGRGSAPADLNSIPISAVKRIEVLRDGQSARYGSDAIAGVINIILKDGPEGGEVSTKVGQYKKGDGTQRELSVNSGFALGKSGWLNVTAEGGKNGYTNRAGADFQSPLATTNGQRDFRFGDPATNNGKILLNGQYDISDDAQLYAIGTFSQTQGENAEFYRQSNSSNNIKALFPNGYLPLTHNVVQDTTLVAGVRGEFLDDWHYDASANYGKNNYEVNIDTINPSLYRDTGSTPFNFYNGTLANSQTLLNIDISKSIALSWLPHPLSVAFGAEYKYQQYKVEAGQPESYYKGGASGLAGFSAGDAGDHNRHSYSEYLDLETKLTDKLTTSLAVRNENYSDFGSTTTASLAGRYDFTPRIAIRGNISNGFRAPSLAQEYFSQTSLQLVNGVLQNAGTFPANSSVAKLFGAEDLKPEKSNNYSLGFTFNPIDRLYITIDGYLIDITDRISLSSAINASTPKVLAYLAANGINNVNYSSVRYFNNASDTRTKGVDLVASYRFLFDNGIKWNSTVGLNFNQTKVTKIKANPTILNQLGVNLLRLDRRETLGLLGESTPETKLTLGNDFSLENWTLHTNLVRYGSFVSYSNVGPQEDQKFGAQWALDMALDYRLQNWTFTLGSDNVANSYPARSQFGTVGGSIPYSEFSPNGFNGAFYYGKVNYRW
ncbi:TonB-dependent receptor plug domain-containing protein [Aquirhabdus sp.]|uniref:TonB-dependent receptor plug domain-containing protein n=1 Tax=Aquirhabdus sp. TaxID=2824160 RepID=UPI00396C4A9F